MNEINIFQSSIWLALIALNAFFIWKYVILNKAIKTQTTTNRSFPDRKVEVKTIATQSPWNDFDIKELSEIIEDIKKEEEISKKDSIQRLMYFAKYVVDPINKNYKNLQSEFKLDPKRIKKQIKQALVDKYPDLSEQEILLCTYIVNGISTAETGLLLKLSNGTVRVYKNKLKTKLNVPNGISIEKYLDITLDMDKS
jgi:DNA-binding CsgD family transcriptional regulator